MDRIENDPAIWEKLFPFDLRREFAFNLADRVSFFPFVNKVVVVPLELEGSGVDISTLYIVVGNYITPFENDQLRKTYLDICQDQASREVLGHIVVTREADFLKQRRESFFKYKEATVVWEKRRKQINDLDRLNLNSCLN